MSSTVNDFHAAADLFHARRDYDLRGAAEAACDAAEAAAGLMGAAVDPEEASRWRANYSLWLSKAQWCIYEYEAQSAEGVA